MKKPIQKSNEEFICNLLLGMGILRIDKRGIICAANTMFYKIAGIQTKEKVVGEKISRLSLQKNIPKLQQATKLAIETGKSTFLKKIPLRHDSEQNRYLDIRVIALKNTPKSTNDDIIISFDDVTETVELKNMIQYLRDYNERIIEASPAGILVTDTTGTITKVNKAHEQLSGRGKEEIIGRTLYKDYAANAPQNMRDAFLDVVTSGKTRVFRYQIYPSARRGIQYFHVRLAPLKDENEHIIGVVQALDDVTKEVKLQQELRQYTKDLEEKIQELNSSYLELGRLNRQLSSLIDIGKLFPLQGASFASMGRIIESISTILGAEFSILRSWSHESASFNRYIIHGKNKTAIATPEELSKIDHFFRLFQKNKSFINILQLSPKQIKQFQAIPSEKEITSLAAINLDNDEKSSQHDALLFCFNGKADFTNLDIELIKAFIERIEQALSFVNQKKPPLPTRTQTNLA